MQKNSDGRTPLHLAAMNIRADTVIALVELGADVNAMDNDGRTPLHLAASNGRPETARPLVEELGADVNATCNDGKTPFDLVAAKSLKRSSELRAILRRL